MEPIPSVEPIIVPTPTPVPSATPIPQEDRKVIVDTSDHTDVTQYGILFLMSMLVGVITLSLRKRYN